MMSDSMIKYMFRFTKLDPVKFNIHENSKLKLISITILMKFIINPATSHQDFNEQLKKLDQQPIIFDE